MRRTRSNLVRTAVFAAAVAGGLAAADWISDSHRASAAPAQNMRAFMVGVVAPAVKPVWDFGYADKISDQDWANIKKAATDLVAAVPTIRSGGPVPSEQTRAASPVWQDWTRKVSDMAAAAALAANNKDQKGLQAAGDTLVELCEGCHMAFDSTAKQP